MVMPAQETAKVKTEVPLLFSKRLTVLNRLGLHLRTAARLVKTASAFDAEIHIASGRRRASAKSILGLLALEVGNGKEVTVTAEGHDAHEAICKIKCFFAKGLGEEESQVKDVTT
jgi:phosphotransferase system HPr (HPr) family protein